jgi:hypothetical protein
MRAADARLKQVEQPLLFGRVPAACYTRRAIKNGVAGMLGMWDEVCRQIARYVLLAEM